MTVRRKEAILVSNVKGTAANQACFGNFVIGLNRRENNVALPGETGEVLRAGLISN